MNYLQFDLKKIIVSTLFVFTLVSVSIHTSYAATFEVPAGDVAALIDAINAANTNMEANDIILASGSTYILTAIDNSTDGDNGLPSINPTEMTIVGNGATIRRASDDVAEFRILHVSETGDLTINNLIVLNGRSSGGIGTEINGGGIYSRGIMEINFCSFTGNSAIDFGGGIANFFGALTINSSVISGNHADRAGGGIDTDGGTVTINDSDISDNDAPETSGGISNFFGTMTINNCNISHNTAGSDGGGVWSNDNLTINRSAIFENSADDFGGGIDNEIGTLTINSSTISHNSAGSDGGGIDTDMGTVDINNSTISSNTADGDGGGIANDAGIVRINSSTITNNSAGDGGGLLNAGFTELTNTIIANQQSGADCFNVAIIGILGSLGHNLDSDGTCLAFTTDGDMPNTDPLLGPLTDNGGPTFTHVLLPGSPAIDMGNPAGCFNTDGVVLTDDQRGPGFPRTVDGNGDGDARCDIGAFEAAVIAIFKSGGCAIAPVGAPIQMPVSMILLVLIGLRLAIRRKFQKR
ncbi:MAG: hypothetical protein IID03_06615 [Candidatus Dadabacteria bacterium]|nr:hypothetical protein [Candidatus Dadabacteria bacterium]